MYEVWDKSSVGFEKDLPPAASRSTVGPHVGSLWRRAAAVFQAHFWVNRLDGYPLVN